MKVALLAPVTWRTPPRAYGPWEQVVSLLAEGLVARGVQVTLFATLDSVTAADLDGVCPRPFGEDTSLDGRVWEALHIAHCLARSGEFDLVHNHLDWLPLAMGGFCRAPLLTTVHGFSSPRILPAYQRSGSAFVSISNADRAPGLSYLATVYHGIDLSQFPAGASQFPAGASQFPAGASRSPAGAGTGEELVAFGRIHTDKGTADAVEIARQAGRPLLICGPVHDEEYHATKVLPHVDGDRVRYLGNVGPADRAAILGGAAALLHPIGFDEPFGLSVVEAMACGTPVVAYRRGSMPEVVNEGETGFLAEDVDSAVIALSKALTLDRNHVRAVARARFSADRMVEDYVRVYQEVIGR